MTPEQSMGDGRGQLPRSRNQPAAEARLQAFLADSRVARYLEALARFAFATGERLTIQSNEAGRAITTYNGVLDVRGRTCRVLEESGTRECKTGDVGVAMMDIAHADYSDAFPTLTLSRPLFESWDEVLCCIEPNGSYAIGFKTTYSSDYSARSKYEEEQTTGVGRVSVSPAPPTRNRAPRRNRPL